MSSSDSSDDENSALLREAVDTQFIQDNMFNSSNTSANTTPKYPSTNGNSQDAQTDIKYQPSLRPNRDQDDQFNMLQVTPQFQEYVAKHLSNILERKLQKKLTNQETMVNSPQKRKKGGIKLFSDSTKFAKIRKTETVVNKPNKKVAESDSDNDAKFSEVCVTPEDILNKKDVKNWSTKSKASVFSYKKSANGKLISLDE